MKTSLSPFLVLIAMKLLVVNGKLQGNLKIVPRGQELNNVVQSLKSPITKKLDYLDSFYNHPMIKFHSKMQFQSKNAHTMCNAIKVDNFRPVASKGYNFNGFPVEIKKINNETMAFPITLCSQDVERHQCQGVDTKRFTSICETIWHEQYAEIRMWGTEEPFHVGKLVLPNDCRCQVFPKYPEMRMEWMKM